MQKNQINEIFKKAKVNYNRAEICHQNNDGIGAQIYLLETLRTLECIVFTKDENTIPSEDYQTACKMYQKTLGTLKEIKYIYSQIKKDQQDNTKSL